VDRVLDVRQGELCWVTGTIYMEMPLKPNILDDLTKEVGSITRMIDLSFL
jgi:DNA polymerase delta subunit 2